MPKHTSKRFLIRREHFETCGCRIQSLAHGAVEFPDGKCCKFNVRLMAKPGSNGDIQLIVEDINSERTKAITLRKVMPSFSSDCQ